jgi:two-component system NarL family response regulator
MTGDIRIVVADDHPVVRAGLVAIIAREPGLCVVGEAADGEQAVALARERQADVVLMDLRMPRLNGVEATARLSAECPPVNVIVLTTYGGDQDILEALHAGARAYLLKDTDPPQLLSAIRSVHAGRRHLPQDVSDRLLQHFDGDALTARETEILRLIVAGLANPAIAGRLAISEGTVKGHVNSIFFKLGVDHRTQAAVAALRRGIVHLDEV